MDKVNEYVEVKMMLGITSLVFGMLAGHKQSNLSSASTLGTFAYSVASEPLFPELR
jgi:hypothetical protein